MEVIRRKGNAPKAGRLVLERSRGQSISLDGGRLIVTYIGRRGDRIKLLFEGPMSVDRAECL